MSTLEKKIMLEASARQLPHSLAASAGGGVGVGVGRGPCGGGRGQQAVEDRARPCRTPAAPAYRSCTPGRGVPTTGPREPNRGLGCLPGPLPSPSSSAQRTVLTPDLRGSSPLPALTCPPSPSEAGTPQGSKIHPFFFFFLPSQTFGTNCTVKTRPPGRAVRTGDFTHAVSMTCDVLSAPRA